MCAATYTSACCQNTNKRPLQQACLLNLISPLFRRPFFHLIAAIYLCIGPAYTLQVLKAPDLVVVRLLPSRHENQTQNSLHRKVHL
jgi:hypothetical protein